MSASANRALGPATPRSARPPRPRTAADDHLGREDDRGWAVVELHRDGTVGAWTVVTARDDLEAIRSVAPVGTKRSARLTTVDSELELRLGRLQASRGHHREAVRSLTRAL